MKQINNKDLKKKQKLILMAILSSLIIFGSVFTGCIDFDDDEKSCQISTEDLSSMNFTTNNCEGDGIELNITQVEMSGPWDVGERVKVSGTYSSPEKIYVHFWPAAPGNWNSDGDVCSSINGYMNTTLPAGSGDFWMLYECTKFDGPSISSDFFLIVSSLNSVGFWCDVDVEE